MTYSSKVPIDRGWAWLVVMGAFLNLAILSGIFKCSGIMFAEMLAMFRGSASGTSTMFAIAAALSLFSAPLVTALSDIFTCRLVSMVGGFICCWGFFVPAFCKTLEQVIFSFGILTGLGYGLCLAPSTIIVGKYFHKHRSLANGIMFSGTGVGGMVVPLFLNYVISIYGLHSSLIILAGLALQTVVFAALYRPLSYWQSRKGPVEKELEPLTPFASPASTQPDQEQLTSNPAVEDSQIFYSTLDISEPSETISNRRYLSLATIPSQNQHLDSKKSHQKNGSLQRFPTRGSLNTRVPSQARSNNTIYFSALDLATWYSMHDIPECIEVDEEETEHESAQPPISSPGNVCKRVLRRLCYVTAADGTDMAICDTSLLKNVRFVLFACACTVVLTGTYISMIVPAHCEGLGMTKTQVALLLSAQGGADTTGRLITGLIGDRDFVKSKRIQFAFLNCIVACISTYSSVALTSFPTWIAYLIITTTVYGSFVAMVPVILVELVGIHNLSRAWGLVMFMEGFSVTLTPVIIGVLRDTTSSYKGGLIFIGSCYAVATLCILALMIYDRVQMKRSGCRDVSAERKQ